MNQTSLHDTHVALSANMVDFAGWRMPVQYGSLLDEVRTVRNKVGLFDLGHMGRVAIKGIDAVAMLDRLTTNHCAKIPVGSIRYGLFCTEDGGAIDDLLVYREEDGGIYLVVNASNCEADLAWLRSHTDGFDVEVIDHTAEQAMLALQGQASQSVLQKVTEDCDLASLKYYRFTFGTVCGIPNVRISRTGYTGEDGFEIYCPDGEAVRVWNELLAAGEEFGIAPIGLGARDTLRLEAGMSLYGHEIDSNHNPVEAALHFGISFAEEKGDWIGREALAKIKADPKQAIMGMTTDGKRVPRQGYKLFSGTEEIGYVVSGSVSPTLDTNIASVYVRVGFDTDGSEVEMDIRGKRQSCRLQKLPFYSRTRK
ncbi:MAG: aminomethyltransferase [Planctomycetota bacterium]|jgi:aminomethyltransferase